MTLTLTAFLLKAAALALVRHPTFNASLDPGAGELVLKRYYHLGVAVATERGLIVPVLRDVDRKPVLEIGRELGALAQRVRDGKATLDDLRGGTFTITNIGALGGTGAIPIINYPEVAILGVARARQEAVVRQGQIVPRLMLPLTLTFDHRVADGADGARFATEIVQLLEAPERLLWEWLSDGHGRSRGRGGRGRAGRRPGRLLGRLPLRRARPRDRGDRRGGSASAGRACSRAASPARPCCTWPRS